MDTTLILTLAFCSVSFVAAGDECYATYCFNGGTCQPGLFKRTCSCPTGYSGNKCHNEYEPFEGYIHYGGECFTNNVIERIQTTTPGTCVNRCNELEACKGFQFKLRPRARNSYCWLQNDHCQRIINQDVGVHHFYDKKEDCSDNLCQNGGTCTGDFRAMCECALGFQGELCQFETPDAPRNFQVTLVPVSRYSKQYTRAEISWEPPATINGRLVGYILTYGEVGKVRGVTERHIGPLLVAGGKKIKTSFLEPGVDYEISVKAKVDTLLSTQLVGEPATAFVWIPDA